MNSSADGRINVNFNLPSPQTWDNGTSQYQMPSADPSANRNLTLLALHALISTVKIAESSREHIPIFA